MLFDESLLLEVPANFTAQLKRQPKPREEEFQDEFSFAYKPVTYQAISIEEAMQFPYGEAWICDVECYTNFFLAGFMHYESKRILQFTAEEYPLDNPYQLQTFLRQILAIGFNSKTYDMPILQLACKGMSTHQLKQASDKIIFSDYRPYQLEQNYKTQFFPTNEIDLIEVAPLRGSLKIYGGRLQCKKMQDLPIHHTTALNNVQTHQVADYNVNDLELTHLLCTNLLPQLSLRYELMKTYRTDLRSKSDAQVAEAIINSELEKITGDKPSRPKNVYQGFFYIKPDFISYQSAQLCEMLNLICNTYFTIEDNGTITLPKELEELTIHLGKCAYRMGIGGLHSSEKSRCVRSTSDTLIIDKDVASYYPSIILNQGLFPRHLGAPFLKVYRELVKRRLDAKKRKDTVVANSLKITINGSFGKFGNMYSTLYSPELLIQVTITGQLALLMLIEMIEAKGIEVLSANTDGVTILCRLEQRTTLDAVTAEWERRTNFVTEEKSYQLVASRDVNNFLALEPSGDWKVKGCYSERGSAGDSVLAKNPENLIVTDAVKLFLAAGVPVEQTIRECKDIRRFLTIRNVKGGGQKSGVYLGKAVRYYYSTAMRGIIQYVSNGNKVPNTEGAMPLMELPDSLPIDIDYDKYIRVAKDVLIDIGAVVAPVGRKISQGSLFDED